MPRKSIKFERLGTRTVRIQKWRVPASNMEESPFPHNGYRSVSFDFHCRRCRIEPEFDGGLSSKPEGGLPTTKVLDSYRVETGRALSVRYDRADREARKKRRTEGR